MSVDDLSREERKALAHAYLDRPRVEFEEAMRLLRRSYPDAPERVLDAMRFHLLVDMPGAIEELLAAIELYLSGWSERPGLSGLTTHLIYHLFNYSLLESLAPRAPRRLAELVDEVERCLIDGDSQGAKGTVAQIKQLLEGSDPGPEEPG